MRTLQIGKNDAGKRLDRFLLAALHDIPPALLYMYFRKKAVRRNGVHAKPEEKLAAGDVLQLYISDEFFAGDAAKDEKSRLLAKLSVPSLTLKTDEIVYEDENILLIDKPQGELVHEGDAEAKDSAHDMYLVDRLQGYLYKKGEYRPEEENRFAPALCNRLDRNTCGIVIAAKNAAALAVLNQKIRDRELTKKYLCVVYGVPEKKEATLRDVLYKDSAANRVYIFPSAADAKRAMRIRYDDDIKSVVTKYRVVKTMGDTSLVEVELITGRTHQIRAHLAYIGHPIVGDGKYGVNHRGETGKKYQMLCSHYLRFDFTTDAGPLGYLDHKEFFSHYSVNMLQ